MFSVILIKAGLPLAALLCAARYRTPIALVLVFVLLPFAAADELKAQEVDALYLEEQASAQTEAVERVRAAMEPHMTEMGRSLVVLSDLIGVERLNEQEREMQRQAYGALGQAFAETVEAFQEGFPQIAERFDSIVGYVGSLESDLGAAATEAERQHQAAERTVEALADTLRMIRRFAASLPNGEACDIDAEPNTCSPRIRRALERLDYHSRTAYARARERDVEQRELEAARAQLAAIREDVISRKSQLADLRERLDDTAAELADRLEHRGRVLAVNDLTEVWRESSRSSAAIQTGLTDAMERMWGDWGRTLLLPWTKEEADSVNSTAEHASRILARSDSLRASGRGGDS